MRIEMELSTKEIIDSQLSSIIFTRADIRSDNILYVAEITGDLLGQVRYFILFVPIHLDTLPMSKFVHSRDINWINVQARCIPKMHLRVKIIPQPFHPKRDAPDERISVIDRKLAYTLYMCRDNAKVMLFHDLKKKSKWQHIEHVNLSGCIEKFNCSITIEEYPVIGEMYTKGTPIEF